MFIENILGAESKIKLLRTLLEINSGFTLKDLEQETGLSRGIIHKEISRLRQFNVVIQVEKQGKLGYYKINMENPYAQNLAKLFDLEKLQERKNKIPLPTWNLLSIIINKILAKNIQIASIILYGSTARGTATIHSYIDLLMVTKNIFKKRDSLHNIINDEQEKSKRKINLSILTEDEFEKNSSLNISIRTEGIILWQMK